MAVGARSLFPTTENNPTSGRGPGDVSFSTTAPIPSNSDCYEQPDDGLAMGEILAFFLFHLFHPNLPPRCGACSPLGADTHHVLSLTVGVLLPQRTRPFSTSILASSWHIISGPRICLDRSYGHTAQTDDLVHQPFLGRCVRERRAWEDPGRLLHASGIISRPERWWL